MKHKFLVKLSATILFFGTIVTAMPASAKTYYSDEFHGTSEQGDNVYLGDGTRYLYGNSISGAGRAKALKIVSCAPDEVVATIPILAGRDTNPDNFEAVGAVESDDYTCEQEYYIVWKGNNSGCGAWLALSD